MNIQRIKQLITFRNLYLFLLLAMLVSLPLSKFLASATQILLTVAWLAEGNFGEKWRRLKMKPHILVFTLLFLVPLAGMLYTADAVSGLHELKLKLPFLFLPLVLGSIRPFDERELPLMLGGFVAAVVAGALVSLSIMLGIGPSDYASDRESVLFISHIRFALMTDLAIFILFFYILRKSSSLRLSLVLLPIALGLTAFLFLLKSLTGIVVLITGGWILALRWSLRQQDFMLRWFMIVGLATVPVLAGFYLTDQVSRFYTVREAPEKPDLLTARGNPYWHDSTNTMIENGYYVGLYQCETELREAWNQVSDLDYDGADRKGQVLKYTLIRYLTSKGLRKDAYGVSQLEAEDIRLVENGFANCLYRNPRRFGVRMYETIWEIDQYHKGANPSGHSVTQRLEYIRTGWAIFRDHPLFGVGTGDVGQAFEQKYTEMNSPLAPEWRLRTHNQFLTFLLTYGLIGFIILMGSIIIPVWIERRRPAYFITMFLLVAFLSMFNEDTLETQAGVAFFVIFYCIFVFADGTSKHESY